jgi:hypothetical protein
MAAMRRHRLERLERRQPRGPVWRDAFPVAMTIWTAMEAEHDAERAGQRFSRLPSDPPTPEADWPPAMAEAMRYYDRLAARLATEADAAQNK